MFSRISPIRSCIKAKSFITPARHLTSCRGKPKPENPVSGNFLMLCGRAIYQSSNAHFSLENIFVYLFAVKFNTNIIKLVSNCYGKEHFSKIFTQKLFGDRNNSLHILARHSRPDSIIEMLKHLDDKSLMQLAVRNNNSGDVPFDELEKNPHLDDVSYSCIASNFFSVTKTDSPKNLSDQIELSDCSEEILKVAIRAVNYARTHIKQSSSHIALKHSPYKANDAILATNKSIEKMRSDLEKEISSHYTIDRYVEKSAEYSMKSGLGNCGEMAAIVHHYLKSMSLKISAEIFTLEPGDHSFNVIGRPIDTDILDPETWGKAVIIDAWGGDVFFAEAMESRLNAFGQRKYQGQISCFMQPYNPDYHKINYISGYYPDSPDGKIKAPKA